MKWRNIVKWLFVLTVAVLTGAFVVGGIVYATTSPSRIEGDPTEPTDTATAVVRLAADDSEAGIVIASVAADGPASNAGMVRGDILLEINGQTINTPFELQRQLASLESGDEIELKVLHGDDERILTAALDERNGKPFLGLTGCGCIELEGLTIISATRGAMITRVAPDSPADLAGLQVGDRIIDVDGQEPDQDNDLPDLITAHQPGDRVTLGIERPGEGSLKVSVELGEHPDNKEVAYLGVEYLPFPRLERFGLDSLPFDHSPFDRLPFGNELFIPPNVKAPLGAIVQSVVQDSPGYRAGLQEGDRIVAVDGQELDKDNDLADLITAYQPGDTVTLEIERQGDGPFEATVELGEHPENEGVAYLGVEYLPFPHIERFGVDQLPFDHMPFEAEPFSIPRDVEQGAIIRSVTADSPAAAAGLREGDVITTIDGEPVKSPRDLVEALAKREPGDTLTLTTFDSKEEEEREVEVTLGENPDEKDKAYLGVTIGGFFSFRRFEGHKELDRMRPFERFFQEFQDHIPFNLEDGPGLRFDRLPFEFDFRLPPGLFKDVPYSPGDSTA